MIKRTDLDARIAKFKNFVAMAPKKRTGMRYARMRTIIDSYLAQADLEWSGSDVTTDLVVFSRMTGIAFGCGLISEVQCMMLDETYAGRSGAAGL